MKNKIILIIICLALFFVMMCSISYSKYILTSNIIAAKLEIDRTKPTGIVSYSIQEMTIENIIVTVSLSEPIKDLDGWILSENRLSMYKIYEQNTIEEITIEDLSGNENSIYINVQNIDRENPKIVLIDIQNSNEGYINYANRTHKITASIKITDLNMNGNIDISLIDVVIGDNTINCTKNVQNLVQSNQEIYFDLVLKEIEGNGLLKIIIPDLFITDLAGNSSNETIFDLDITIDNIAPEGIYSQNILQNGKVNAVITSNEEIRNIEGWNSIDNMIFKKEFPANVSYIVEILDYAQNKSEVEVNITGATYIVFKYASHNSEVGWTYGLGNYDIAGEEAVKRNSKFKTEALAFRITGGISSTFVKIKAYVNSFWNGLSDYGKCADTGYKYKVGETEQMTMSFDRLSTINGENYIQCGGSGINCIGRGDYYGNNPISNSAIGYPNYTYPYGVSEIQIELEDYSELSVVYQILVDGTGWTNTASNGEVLSQNRDKPMSAIRVAIIPNSEKESLIDLWNKDVGTYNTN